MTYMPGLQPGKKLASLIEEVEANHRQAQLLLPYPGSNKSICLRAEASCSSKRPIRHCPDRCDVGPLCMYRFCIIRPAQLLYHLGSLHLGSYDC
jgi:hypothetical protein